ncbi:hypothetical protein EPM78_06260 [Neisseria gonorrhoeae]|nr:hypothetical protein FNL98_13030 [Neisseria gonorrhoeae]QDM64490.1 hypothetical protein FNL99_11290 [Neisseria gonorrhoeae]QIH15826.1 hypothetical protein F0T11_11535 [Neisseria gonorrhoeae]QIH18093.1 hypothetical protein F0T12_11555 [Neisseria gonorrhoeae]QIH20373.1 hypothetical protein F0T10_11595 [Neisseria gonorrhoeae]
MGLGAKRVLTVIMAPKSLKAFILLFLPCLGIKNAVRTLPADKFQTAFSTASIRQPSQKAAAPFFQTVEG